MVVNKKGIAGIVVGIIVLVLLAGTATLYYTNNLPYFSQSVFQGSTGTIAGIGPNCLQADSGEVSNVFVCNQDKCVVDVIYPESKIVEKTIANWDAVQGQGRWVSASGYNKYIYDCSVEGQEKVIPAEYWYHVARYLDETKWSSSLENIGCFIGENCIVTYDGTYTRVAAYSSYYRTSCDFNIQIKEKSINENIVVTNLGKTLNIPVNYKIQNINDQSLVDDARTVEKIYLSEGGVVSASGAIIKYDSYAQCVDCSAGTGICDIGSVQCVTQTAYQNCIDNGNSCGVYSVERQVGTNQICVNNKLACDNACSIEGLRISNDDSTGYQVCTKNFETGCLFLSQEQSCPTGTLFDSGTGKCDICANSNSCQYRENNEQFKINDTSYGTCKQPLFSNCKELQVTSCPSGKIVDDNFNCITQPLGDECVQGVNSCSTNNEVLSCTYNNINQRYEYSVSSACSDSEVCTNGVCQSGFAWTIATTDIKVGQAISFNGRVQSSITSNEGFIISATLLDSNKDFVSATSSSPITKSDGVANIKFPSVSTPGTYIVSTSVSKTLNDGTVLSETFEDEFIVLRNLYGKVSGDIIAFNNQPIVLELSYASDSTFNNYVSLNTPPIVSLTVNGVPINNDDLIVSLSSVGRYRVSYDTAKIGDFEWSITANKNGYAQTINTFSQEVQGLSLNVVANADLSVNPGIDSFTVTVRNPQGDLTDASRVIYFVNSDNLQEQVLGERTGLGTYEVSYEYKNLGFYDNTLRVEKSGTTPIEKSYRVSVIGGGTDSGSGSQTGGESNNTMLYILLGVAVLFIIGGVALLFFKRK